MRIFERLRAWWPRGSGAHAGVDRREIYVVRQYADLALLRTHTFNLHFRPARIVIEPGLAGLDERTCRLIGGQLSKHFDVCGCDAASRAALIAASVYLCIVLVTRQDSTYPFGWAHLLTACLIFLATGTSVSVASRVVARHRAKTVLVRLMRREYGRDLESMKMRTAALPE